ncbi:VOC family protein [Georgenia satyanarayanai]|uniref:VOC family protein n=1 Tax=Georgenia satyanarayanai TaxID=860221 RepID=UPI00203B3C65|nr:VOC family protein [Georgenia satyanarayanai]MCM3659752.1 VOC family protein [Georgenia satyanarayanai]
MKITRLTTVFDAADIGAESHFWAGVLGGTVDPSHDDWHNVVIDGTRPVAVQLAPGHVPPQWPDGNPQQVHLDLWVEDVAAAHEHVMSVGAQLLQEAQDPDDDEDFQVYASPAGHPFCLCFSRTSP